MALARPAIGGAGGIFGSSVTAAILIDNSYSMSATDGGPSRFDQAKSAAEQILRGLPSGSAAALLLVSDGVDAVVPEPTTDLNLLRKLISQAKLTDRGTEHANSIRAR